MFSFTGTTNTSKYRIGICTAPDSTFPNSAIIQTQNNESIVLGQIDQVNLAEKG